MVSLVKGRVNFVKEHVGPGPVFSSVAPTEYAAKDVKKRWVGRYSPHHDRIDGCAARYRGFLLQAFRRYCDWLDYRARLSHGKCVNAFRLSVVGECKGPHMFDITELIGKEETLARIQRAVDALK